MTLTSPAVSTTSISAVFQALKSPPGRVAPSLPMLPNMPRRNAAAKHGADQLPGDVHGYPGPRKIAAKSEGDGDCRVEVGAADGAHEVDDGHDHQPGYDDLCIEGDLTVALGVDHRGAGGHQHQEERAERLGEDPAPLVGRIEEVPGPCRLEPNRLPVDEGQRLGDASGGRRHGVSENIVATVPGIAFESRWRARESLRVGMRGAPRWRTASIGRTSPKIEDIARSEVLPLVVGRAGGGSQAEQGVAQAADAAALRGQGHPPSRRSCPAGQNRFRGRRTT